MLNLRIGSFCHHNELLFEVTLCKYVIFTTEIISIYSTHLWIDELRTKFPHTDV